MRSAANRNRYRISAFLPLCLGISIPCVLPVNVDAQTQGEHSVASGTMAYPTDHSWETWEIGGFASGGFAPGYMIHTPHLHYQEELLFYDAGLEVGRMVTAIHGHDFIRGRGEAVLEISPYWQVSRPSQTFAVYVPGHTAEVVSTHVDAYSIHGSSVTPFQFRWNFIQKETSRWIPWIEPGVGLLWTNQEFPAGYGTVDNPPVAMTSHINFTPQVSFGENIFVRRDQSLSMGVQAIHITNFGLTAYDPGVNVIVEFRIGYSWWR